MRRGNFWKRGLAQSVLVSILTAYMSWRFGAVVSGLMYFLSLKDM